MAMSAAGMKLTWEKKLARAYELHVTAGQPCTIPAGPCAHLLIGIFRAGRAGNGLGGSIGKEIRRERGVCILPGAGGLQTHLRDEGRLRLRAARAKVAKAG